MVRIRLRRIGAKGQPYYRIVVADADNSRNGRFIEVIGHYNPSAKVSAEGVTLNQERADYWLSVGAQPSDSVKRILEWAKAS
jgi:small subunit ribosomal protein S16